MARTKIRSQMYDPNDVGLLRWDLNYTRVDCCNESGGGLAVRGGERVKEWRRLGFLHATTTLVQHLQPVRNGL